LPTLRQEAGEDRRLADPGEDRAPEVVTAIAEKAEQLVRPVSLVGGEEGRQVRDASVSTEDPEDDAALLAREVVDAVEEWRDELLQGQGVALLEGAVHRLLDGLEHREADRLVLGPEERICTKGREEPRIDAVGTTSHREDGGPDDLRIVRGERVIEGLFEPPRFVPAARDRVESRAEDRPVGGAEPALDRREDLLCRRLPGMEQ